MSFDNPDPFNPNLTDEQSEVFLSLRYVDGKTLALLALASGWTPTHVGGGVGGMLFIADDGTRFSVPIVESDQSVKSLRSNVRKVLRHRKPNGPPPLVIVERVIDYLKMDASRATTLRILASEAGAPTVAGSPVEPVPDDGGSSEPAPVVTPPGRHRKRRITREEPWSAHRNQSGVTYPSDAVMERTWNDGTTDFACRWEGCDFTDDNARTVAAHNGAHKRGQGKSPQPEVDGFDPNHVPGTSRTRRIFKLRREVDGALTAALAQGIDFSVVDQAEWIATWIIDHRVEPVKGSGDEADEVELTPEQILDRIAALADRGRGKILREQVDSTQALAEDYLEQLTEAQAQRDAALAKASRVEGNLSALRDMFNETLADPEVTQ